MTLSQKVARGPMTHVVSILASTLESCVLSCGDGRDDECVCFTRYRTRCSLDAHSMLTRCSLDAHSMLTRCSLDAHSMLTRCSLDAHSMLTRCASITRGQAKPHKVSAVARGYTFVHYGMHRCTVATCADG